MIKLQDMTPAVYYTKSRDFQFIGRLFDVVLNSVKTNAELVYNCPLSENSNKQLIDLMAMTLGFKSKHHYNLAQLTALCSAFSEIIKCKGTEKAIQLAGDALIRAEGITQPFSFGYKVNTNGIDYSVINAYLPSSLSDINLFKDLLAYILPAGVRCNIIRESEEYIQLTDATRLTTADKISIYRGDSSNEYKPGYNTNLWSTIVNTATVADLDKALAEAKHGIIPFGELQRTDNDPSVSRDDDNIKAIKDEHNYQ